MKTKLFVIAAFVLGLAFASCDSNDPLDPKSKSNSVPALAIAINRKPAAEAKTILLKAGYTDKGEYYCYPDVEYVFQLYQPNHVFLTFMFEEDSLINFINGNQLYETDELALTGFCDWGKQVYQHYKSHTLWIGEITLYTFEQEKISFCQYVEGTMADEYRQVIEKEREKYPEIYPEMKGNRTDFENAIKQISLETEVFALVETCVDVNKQNDGTRIQIWCNNKNGSCIPYRKPSNVDVSLQLNSGDLTDWINANTIPQ